MQNYDLPFMSPDHPLWNDPQGQKKDFERRLQAQIDSNNGIGPFGIGGLRGFLGRHHMTADELFGTPADRNIKKVVLNLEPGVDVVVKDKD